MCQILVNHTKKTINTLFNVDNMSCITVSSYSTSVYAFYNYGIMVATHLSKLLGRFQIHTCNDVSVYLDLLCIF